MIVALSGLFSYLFATFLERLANFACQLLFLGLFNCISLYFPLMLIPDLIYPFLITFYLVLLNYCPFDITRKDVFCLAFYFR